MKKKLRWKIRSRIKVGDDSAITLYESDLKKFLSDLVNYCHSKKMSGALIFIEKESGYDIEELK